MLPRSAGMRRRGRARRGIDVLEKWRMARLGVSDLPGIAGAQELAGEVKRFFSPGGNDEFSARGDFRRWAPKGASETLLPRKWDHLGNSNAGNWPSRL